MTSPYLRSVTSLILPLLALGGVTVATWAVDSVGLVPEEVGRPTSTPPAQNAEAERLAVHEAINQEYLPLKPVFQKGCFDCHSQAPNYPWYYGLPFITGMIDRDIEEGREAIDFTNDFPFSGKGELVHLLYELKEEIEIGGMPPWPYRMTHWGRMIEGEQQDSVFAWIERSVEKLEKLEIAR